MPQINSIYFSDTIMTQKKMKEDKVQSKSLFNESEFIEEFIESVIPLFELKRLFNKKKLTLIFKY